MTTSLDQRFKQFIVELAQKCNIQYTPELHSKLTDGIVVGYHPNNTWDNAEKVITARFNELNKEVA